MFKVCLALLAIFALAASQAADCTGAFFSDLMMHSPPDVSHGRNDIYNFQQFNSHDRVLGLLKEISEKHPTKAEVQILGTTYEHRSIANLKISSNISDSKPAILIVCGLYGDLGAVSSCSFFAYWLLVKFSMDREKEIQSLVQKYEFNIVALSNPDGYEYNRMLMSHKPRWRKNRSPSSSDWLQLYNCRGTNLDRNFDIDHCGAGSSHEICDNNYCGDKAFYEKETSALRDLMDSLGTRLKAYFSINVSKRYQSQYWMTPYGYSKEVPDNFSDLERVATAGALAMTKKYQYVYQVGTAANITKSLTTGTSVDYAYVKAGVKMAFSVELRDASYLNILPVSEETFDGLIAAIQAL